MYGFILALAAFVFAAYFLIKDDGGRPTEAVQELTIHDLTTRIAEFKGKVVTTTGRVTFSEEHGEYQVTDDGNFAVIIRGWDDRNQLAALKDKYARVTGTFDFEDGFGVFIQADTVVPVESP